LQLLIRDSLGVDWKRSAHDQKKYSQQAQSTATITARLHIFSNSRADSTLYGLTKHIILRQDPNYVRLMPYINKYRGKMPLTKDEKKLISQTLITLLFIILIVTGAFSLTSMTIRNPILEQLARKAGAMIENKALDDKMTDYSMEMLPKGSRSLAESGSGVILVNFWGTYCAPCVDEFPSFVRLAKRFKGIKIIAVSYDDSRATIQDFLDKNVGILPANFIVTRDPADTQRDLKTMFGTQKIPETYVIINNTIQARFLGSVDWDSPKVIKMVNYLLGTTK